MFKKLVSGQAARLGFTLAEVLITLGIIGVVAAMTMPTLIANYQRKQTEAKLKYTYSLISQAYNFAKLDYGPIEYWDWHAVTVSPKTLSEKYIKPYYKIISEVKNFPVDYKISCSNKSFAADCSGYGALNSERSVKYMLENGVLFTMGTATSNDKKALTIITDLNGYRGPNRYGRDVFMFSIDEQRGFIPYGLGILWNNSGEDYVPPTRDFLMNGEDRSCKNAGLFCAGVIMLDGWQIKSDYPW